MVSLAILLDRAAFGKPDYRRAQAPPFEQPADIRSATMRSYKWSYEVICMVSYRLHSYASTMDGVKRAPALRLLVAVACFGTARFGGT
jgi:hypothetical protein